MNVRYVLDEWSWSMATDWAAVESAVLALLDRIDVARDREEMVGCHPEYLYTTVLGVALCDLLFGLEHRTCLERDTRVRLGTALAKATNLQDIESLTTLDITAKDVTAVAPGAVWAHQQVSAGQAVALLPLPLPGAPAGPVAVTVEVGQTPVTQIVHWVTTEAHARAFFRDAIILDDVTGADLRHRVGSAYPDLEWVDSVWQELRADWTHFFAHDRREVFFRHLAALDDHGQRIFAPQPPKMRPASDTHIAAELGSLGVDASDENGPTMANAACKADRTRNWVRPPRGERRTEERRQDVFRWHTKIAWNLGRVHFAYLALKPDDDESPTGRIVIGICKDHCKLVGAK